MLSKDNSKPVIAQPTTVESIRNSELNNQSTSLDNETAPIQNRRVQNGIPRTFKISLTVSNPQDLKVKPGDEISLGQVLSDRTTERQRLLTQKKQLEISLKKLDLPIPELTQPKPIPALSKLPPVSYQQEEANIALKQQELAEAEKAIANQEEKINQLSELSIATQSTEVVVVPSHDQQSSSKPPVNALRESRAEQTQKLSTVEIASNTIPQPKTNNQKLKIIIEHEQAILSQLKAARGKAKLQLDIAHSQLLTAKEQRAHAEYQRYIEETKRVIALQQQQIELERQRSIRAGQIQEREYSKAQIQAKIQEIDNAISNLSTVKAPYPGRIKKVKWTGQSDHNLTVTLTLDVDEGSEE